MEVDILNLNLISKKIKKEQLEKFLKKKESRDLKDIIKFLLLKQQILVYEEIYRLME